MSGKTLFCILILAVSRVFAQSAFAPESQLPEPLQPRSLFESQSIVTDSALPQILTQAFLRYKNLKPVACESTASVDYTIALTIQGNYKACSDFAAKCLRRRPSRDVNIQPSLVIQGARCAALDFDYPLAYSMFHKGLKAAALKSIDNQAYFLEFAMLARYSLYPQWTEGILALNPNWNAEQKKLALGFVELAGNTSPTFVSKEQVFNFVDTELLTATGPYQQYLKAWRLNLFAGDYQFEKAYQFLNADAAALDNPLDWYNTGFNLLYKINADEFKTAARFYAAFLPFAHARSPFPKESNIYTYSQLRDDVCQGSMLQGKAFEELSTKVNRWKAGSLTLSQLLSYMKNSPQVNFNKSDFLSTYAGLLNIAGQAPQAESFFWRAHQACPWNNRAHWGQVLLQRQKKYRAFPEFKTNETYVTETLKNIPFPLTTGKYFSNWNSLPAASQNRVKYAARIWAPYLTAMLASGSQSYIKPPFEVLSLAPGMAELKDARVSYPFDNRLWDDVRGAGGISVAADHDEVFQTVQGDYNLLGHEMAHQFHAFLGSQAPLLYSCIDKLYDGAKKRNVYPDGYAKSNFREYFAQGVTYYLVPSTSPARYGVNRAWLPKNDPDLFNFIQSIDSAGGDLSKITCPL